MKGLVSLFWVVLFLGFASAAYAGRAPQYLGMGKYSYTECIELGSAVIQAQKTKPDGPEHKRAYQEWDNKCGIRVMLPLAKKYNLKSNEFPLTPLDWSKMKK